MKNKKSIIIIIAVILIGTFVYFKNKGPLITELSESNNNSIQTTNSATSASNQSAATNNNSNTTTNISVSNSDILIQDFPKTPIESINFFTKVTNEIIKNNLNKEVLINQLKHWKLSPSHSIDKNQYTGEMNMIRTKNGLPGTRYFHAQFFDGMLQHLSFEYEKNQKSFDQAIEVAKKQFNITVNPTSQTKDFISWPIEKGRIVWIKKLDENDIKNNPFNAYSKEDIGTIKIAVELEIHGETDGDDHDHQ